MTFIVKAFPLHAAGGDDDDVMMCEEALSLLHINMMMNL